MVFAKEIWHTHTQTTTEEEERETLVDAEEKVELEEGEASYGLSGWLWSFLSVWLRNHERIENLSCGGRGGAGDGTGGGLLRVAGGLGRGAVMRE